jgi:hypothetical protein
MNSIAFHIACPAHCAVYDFEERAFFAQDESQPLCGGEIVAAVRIGFEPHPIGFIRRQAGKADETPRDIVTALVRQKVAHQVSAATRDDMAPSFCVLLEGFALKGVYLIANEAHNAHRMVPR